MSAGPVQAVMRASKPVRESEEGAVLEFEQMRDARYDRVHVFTPGAEEDAVRVVDVASLMRGVGGKPGQLNPGDTVVVPTHSGEWSESEIRKRLSGKRPAARDESTGGTQ